MNSVFAVGANETLLWGMNARERLRRIARAQKLLMTEIESEAALLVNLDFAFDPSWLRFVAARPDHVLSFGGVPVVAHCSTPTRRAAVIAAMQAGKPVEASGLTITAYEQSGDLINDELRKRERPFVDRLVPERVPSLERASYFGAYKGVTDLLTKYLWPEWALVLTRLAARIGATPNMVTAFGGTLCVLATIAFYYGWYWSGMLAGLGFMVLDTVDGKLARCTITSSKWGEFFDHGIDLVHPPFWWYAWGVGLAAYGRPLERRPVLDSDGGDRRRLCRAAADRGRVHQALRDAHPCLAPVRQPFPAGHRAPQPEHGDPVRRLGRGPARPRADRRRGLDAGIAAGPRRAAGAGWRRAEQGAAPLLAELRRPA